MTSPLSLLVNHQPQAFVAFAVALIVAITVHEFCHALVATVQGDQLPRAQHRLSLNPLRHLDPYGTLLILLVGIGWGKPVQFQPSSLRFRRAGAAMVGLAGPASNIALAFLSAGILSWGLQHRGWSTNIGTGLLVWYLFEFNVILGVFNLLPVPPLDGSRLLSILLPPSQQGIIYFLDRYGLIILIAILFLNSYGHLGILSDAITSVEGWILSVFGLHLA